MIKRNISNIFIRVAPGCKSKLTQAGTCTTEMSENRATRVSVPKRRCGTRWQYQARKSKKLHHKDAMKLTETVYVMMMRTMSGPCNEKLMGLLRAVSLPLGKASPGTSLLHWEWYVQGSRQWRGEDLKRRSCCRGRSRGNTE